MLNGLVALSKDSKKSKVFRDWGKQFSIKFEIEITKDFTSPTWLNVFHMTIGGNNHQHGDRIPALFIRNTKKLFFTMSVGDNHNYHWNFPYQLNQNYSVEIEQKWEIQSEKLMFCIQIDGNSVHCKENLVPRSFQEVYLYLSDKWFTTFADYGKLRNFKIIY